ncbi:hypothetical protein [Polaribacter sp.]|uniref:hypothetical protein n=1 Tax=Polaribacter sp. TaxID=1920175 RepID=UPI0040488A0D
MRNIFLITFWLFTCTIFSQKRTITIVDSITKGHIEYANIKYLNSKYGTFSDSLGLIDLNEKLSERVLISVLGYENKIIHNKNIKDTIFLKPKTIILDEISINTENSKQDYGFHLIKGKFIGSSVERAVIAVYIKNEKPNIESFISSLHFKIRKKRGNIAIIRPHLYTINTITKTPDKELLEHNLLIKEKKEKKGVISINIFDKKILFPKEGIFVALEWVGNTKDIDFGYNEVKEKSENTLITSLNFKKKIWIPLVLPKSNKSILANFGITTIESEK